MSIGSINSSALQSLTSNLFRRLDTQQTGSLSSTNLQAAFSTDSSTDTSSLFTTLDRDSDGQITETEFSDGIQTLVDALQSQLQSSRLQAPEEMQGMGMMPPPPAPSGADEGFTQEELSNMSTDLADTNNSMSTLMSSLASNFDSADADGNGRISRDEAIAFDQSQSTSSTTSASSEVTDNAQLLAQLVRLLQAYGVAEESTSASLTAAA